MTFQPSNLAPKTPTSNFNNQRISQPSSTITPEGKSATFQAIETIPAELRPTPVHIPRYRLIAERVLGGICFLLTLPIMAIIYLRIRCASKGAVVFSQSRVGLGGKTFRFVKFRTMYADAKERHPELYAYDYTPEALDKLKFKVENDPRVTPEGKWLRASSLDELPNFWNVMTGSMVMIGPRPEIPEMIPYYEGEMLDKFSVRPGITGMAQAYGRGNLGFRDTVDLDVGYVHKQSLSLDIKLFFLTIYKVLRSDGAF